MGCVFRQIEQIFFLGHKSNNLWISICVFRQIEQFVDQHVFTSSLQQQRVLNAVRR